MLLNFFLTVGFEKTCEGHKFISYAIMCYPRKIKSLLLLLLKIKVKCAGNNTIFSKGRERSGIRIAQKCKKGFFENQ